MIKIDMDGDGKQVYSTGTALIMRWQAAVVHVQLNLYRIKAIKFNFLHTPNNTARAPPAIHLSNNNYIIICSCQVKSRVVHNYNLPCDSFKLDILMSTNTVGNSQRGLEVKSKGMIKINWRNHGKVWFVLYYWVNCFRGIQQTKWP